MLKAVYVDQIREREWVESPFLVRDKIMAMAKNGKPYMTLKLVDRTGEVEGRVWDRVDEFGGRFEKDDFIQVKGKASVYMGKMQLVIQDLERIEEEQADLADYMPVSERPVEAMVAELKSKVAVMTDVHLKALMEAFLADERFMRGYVKAPAAKAMHHVYLGGLLEHSLAVASLAEDVAGRYPGINRDLLVTGALLHDIGKIDELTYARTFDYSDDGKLLGHIVLGVEMVEEKIRLLPEFPRNMATVVKHLLLSHHGQYEYGSPKRPKTLEAVVLNFLDDLDSKINGVRTHIEREPDSTSSWTGYHRLYDRYFFKNTPGSAKAPERPPERAEPAAVQAAAAAPPEKKTPQARDRGRKAKFGFTLGDQLRGKNPDLFAADDDDKE